MRLEQFTRITVSPTNREFMKNTEDEEHAIGPLCSEIEGMTLNELDDITLSRSIARFALRVSAQCFALFLPLLISFFMFA